VTSAAQENEEIFALQRFWAACPLSLDSYAKKGETPDFLFLPSRLGLEVTELVRSAGRSGSTDRSQEAYQEQVTTMAARKFEADRPGVFVEVHLAWMTYPDQRIRRDALAGALADWVSSNVPTRRHAHIEVDHRDLGGQSLLSGTVAYLSVVRLDPGPSFWNSGAGSAPDLYPDEMQTHITRKESTVSAIRDKAEHAWLLIYAPGNLASNHINIQPSTAVHRYTSSFDRVFIMDWWRWDHLIELGVD